MDWFRWHNGTVTDPKWRVVSRRAGVPVHAVVAVWAAMLENANESAERGTLERFECEDVAAALELDVDQVVAVRDAMQGKVLKGDALTGWQRRQPLREDSSTERVRKHRERKKVGKETGVERDVTQGNAPDKKRVEESRVRETNQLTARVSADEEERISFVIRLANRGMNDNPAIDQELLRPILPQHGKSRQAVADWRKAGVDWPTIEATVYEGATRYEPNGRYNQIGTLAYFDKPVEEAHEKAASLSIDTSALPTQAQAENGFKFLAGDPALQEWAARLDDHLRSALGESATLSAEFEKVRAHLRSLNEQDKDFTRMKKRDQESFLWIRLLNWYGEKIDDPRPSSRRLAAVGA